MRTNIDIDDRLMRQAMRSSGSKPSGQLWKQVAARNASAGSRWDRRALLVASATSGVRGASLSGAIAIDCATHSSPRQNRTAYLSAVPICS